MSIQPPRDRKRESLFRAQLFNTKVISGFGVEPVDRMIWPPLPLREQYPLLELMADLGDEAYFKALRKVAESGDAEGQYLLGRAYDRGEGTTADAAQALRWWEASAKGGYGPGLCAAAEAWLTGNGTRPDEARGQGYLEKAAALGHARAMTLLGARELTGNAPKKSGLGGLARIRRAAAEGDPEGLLILSRAYSKGSEVGGVAKDPARGERLLQAAAAWGHPPAMRALGWHNRNQDPGQKKEAWVWFYLAAKYNTSLARRDYEVIKKEAIAEVLRLREVLSATELEAAQREATAREAMYRPLWTR